MKNEILQLNIVIKDVYTRIDYKLLTIGDLLFVEITNLNKSYLVVGSIPGVANQRNIFCSNCGVDFYYSSDPVIAIGNGELFLFMRCINCDCLSCFLIEENARIAIKRTLKLTNEQINQEFKILESQYSQ